jgi:hypothetical protein
MVGVERFGGAFSEVVASVSQLLNAPPPNPNPTQQEGLVNYKEIVEVADAIILSRGSMGNCLDPEKMFVAQKMLLSVSGRLGRAGGWLGC